MGTSCQLMLDCSRMERRAEGPITETANELSENIDISSPEGRVNAIRKSKKKKKLLLELLERRTYICI